MHKIVQKAGKIINRVLLIAVALVVVILIFLLFAIFNFEGEFNNALQIEFDYDKSDKSICLDNVYFKRNNEIKNSDWKIFDTAIRTKIDENAYAHSRDIECKKHRDKVRYLVSYSSEKALSLLGCINFIGGGSSPAQNYNFYVEDLKSGEEVYALHFKGCNFSSYKKEFYDRLAIEMLK